MKKFLLAHKYKVLIGLFIFIFLFSIPFLFNKEEKIVANLNFYDMKLVFDEKNNVLEGKENIEYFNNSENAFSSLYFHLYPNAFRENANVSVVSSSNYDEAFPNGASYGHIEIESVSNNDGSLDYKITGDDENILQIILNEDLYPDESVELCIEFNCVLPNANHRFGYGENTINLGNFYPIACVYEDGKGFFTKPYHSNGDPFYSDIANYKIDFTCSSNLTVASSGEIINKSETEENNLSNYLIEENLVRDFCLVLSNKFEVVSSKLNNVTVNYYGYQNDEDLQENLDFAVDCLKTYNSMFGTYPYNQLSIVKSNFVHGGMEWPNLVMISDSILNKDDFKYVIAHEIAHQWWYGVVGNNQYGNAWIDEGLTEYSTYLFYQKNTQYGLNYDEMIKNACDNYNFFVKVYNQINGEVDTSMDRPLNEFKTEPEYVHLTYTKGVLLFDSLRESLGDIKFFSALKNYFKTYSYKNVSSADFIACFSKNAGQNLEEFITSWIEGKVLVV